MLYDGESVREVLQGVLLICMGEEACYLLGGLVQACCKRRRVNLSTHPSSLYIDAFTYIGNKYFYIQIVSKILIDLLSSTKLSIFAALSGDNLSHYV